MCSCVLSTTQRLLSFAPTGKDIFTLKEVDISKSVRNPLNVHRKG